MDVFTTYKVRIKGFNRILDQTVGVYRDALDFFIRVIDAEWDSIAAINSSKARVNFVESITVETRKRPSVPYPFGKEFEKYPCYLRRATISEALGKVSSYRSNLRNWEAADEETRDEKPGFPAAGYSFPCMYRENMFLPVGSYTAAIKVRIRNTWDWVMVTLRKSDVDYIKHHCSSRQALPPTLTKRGKKWYLDFAFRETAKLIEEPVWERDILSVDLGINHACVCTVMDHKGTLKAREFFDLAEENDSLRHAMGRLKKAQRHGAKHMPGLWARVNGINEQIAVKTARFISFCANLYGVHTVVFEHLSLEGKKRGSRKWRLHLWKANRIQELAAHQLHRDGVHVSHVCAWGTSRLAFDGSGRVSRGTYLQDGKERYNYSICVFANGKTYNCDLNAAYNIGARYFIREILKSLPETVGLRLQAKVPEAGKRSTATLSTLIRLNAALASSYDAMAEF